MNKIKNVISLCNGFGGCALVLDMLGIKPDNIYSSEIDKYANKAANALCPETIQLGDIKNWREWDIDFRTVNLVTCGFPCQPWSKLGNQKGDKDPRGEIVHILIDIWNECKKYNPEVKFMFENVKMEKVLSDYADELFGMKSDLIDSALLSPQSRVRRYWQNITNLENIKDTGKKLVGILEDLPSCNIGIKLREKARCVRVGGRTTVLGDRRNWSSPFIITNRKLNKKNNQEKSSCLTVGGHGCGNHSDMDIVHSENYTRRYSVRECARLQGLTESQINTLLSCGVSNSQLYKMIANGWQLDTIKYIFKGLLD